MIAGGGSGGARAGRRGSLRTQLIAWNVLALAVLLGVLGFVVRVTVTSVMMSSVDRDLEERLRPMDGGPGPGPFPFFDFGHRPGERPGDQPGRRGPEDTGQPMPLFAPPMRQSPSGPDGRSRLAAGNSDRLRYRPHPFAKDGSSADPSDSRPAWDPAALKTALTEGREVYSTVTVDGEPLRVLSRPLQQQQRSQSYDGTVQTAYPLTDVYRALDVLNRALLLLIPVGLLGAAAGGAYLTEQVLRRVRLLAQAAGEIQDPDGSERLPVVGSDEFASLAASFNGVLERLEAAFRRQEALTEQQRRFTADASHELKTPLTVIKGSASMALRGKPAEAAYRQALEEIDGAADSMSHLVGDLLTLARADAGRLAHDRIELLAGEVLEAAARRVPRPAAGAAPTVTIRLDDPALTVLGSEPELIRLFTNLIDNAVRYTPADGRVTVTARRAGDLAVVEVADTGPGIAPEHLPHLGERFYRADAARARAAGGTGLGLSIARSIAEAHGGSIAFASALGQGTTVTVTLPAAES